MNLICYGTQEITISILCHLCFTLRVFSLLDGLLLLYYHFSFSLLKNCYFFRHNQGQTWQIHSSSNEMPLFYLFIFNWRIIAFQYCIGFYQTSTWISHWFTYALSHLNTSLPPHPYTSFPIPLSRMLLKPGLSSLSHMPNFHWLSILHLVMYISMLLSPQVSPSPSCPPTPSHVQKSVLFVCLYCCSANRFISTIFLDSIYMH